MVSHTDTEEMFICTEVFKRDSNKTPGLSETLVAIQI